MSNQDIIVKRMMFANCVSVGKHVITKGVEKEHRKHALWIGECLKRHMRGDWGDVSKNDSRANNEALLSNGFVMSVFTHPETKKDIWIVTDAYWCASDAPAITTVLLPSEY